MFNRVQAAVGDAGAGAGGGGGDAAAEAAAAAAAEAAAKAGKSGESLIASGAEKPEQWLPEKFQVKDKDGKIDEAKSVRALAKGYSEATKRMVDTGLAPETPEGYEVTVPDGWNLEELKKDPAYASKLKGYHALGMTNKQVQQVLSDFFEIGPEIAAAGQEQSNAAAAENLKLVWKTPEEMTSNIQAATKATLALGQSIGIGLEEIEQYGLGNNPLFIRLMREYARQTGEDRAPMDPIASAPSGEWDAVNKRLRGELDAIAESDPKARRAKLAQITAHYERRFPKRNPVINQQSAA